MPKLAPFILIASAISITACSALAPEPTATPTATDTNTPLPSATSTLEPTATETSRPPTDTPQPLEVVLDPQGTPAAEWNGIPIMPGAIAGEGDSSGYTFRVNATTEEVFAFYDRELAALGYTLFATGDAENNSVLAFYQKGADLITVAAIAQDDGSVIVMIV